MIPEGEGSHQDGRQGELMVKFLFFISLLQSSWFAYAKTVKSIAIAPQGAVIVAGTSVQYSVTCTYSDDTSDNCAAAGGATWTTPTLALSVNNTGLATWNPHNDPENSTLYASGAQTAQGIVTVTVGGLRDSGTLLGRIHDRYLLQPIPPLTIEFIEICRLERIIRSTWW